MGGARDVNLDVRMRLPMRDGVALGELGRLRPLLYGVDTTGMTLLDQPPVMPDVDLVGLDTVAGADELLEGLHPTFVRDAAGLLGALWKFAGHSESRPSEPNVRPEPYGAPDELLLAAGGWGNATGVGGAIGGRAEAMARLSANGVNDVNMADAAALFGDKAKGTARRVMIVIPHQDDETSIAGALSRIASLVGGENMMVLYTTLGDGNKANASADEREKFGLEKMAFARKSLEAIGVPEQNVRYLNASEVRWYNGFITPSVRRATRAGERTPATLPPDFEEVGDLSQVAYLTGNWIYSNMKAFRPEVVISPERMNTVQMHDWANILTKHVLQQYEGEEGPIDHYVFPQQNKNGAEGKTRLYRYPPEFESGHAVLRFPLDAGEQLVKNMAGQVYFLGSWTDRLLFLGYWLTMGPLSGVYRHFKRYDYLRYEADRAVALTPPPREEQGFPFFEGNDRHFGVPHSFADDFTDVLTGLRAKLAAHPFVAGVLETFDPFQGNSAH